MAEQRTTRDLAQAGLITSADVDAAIDAAWAEPGTGEFRLGAYTLDLAAAVTAIPCTRGWLADPRESEAFKREALRSAILLGRPVRAWPPKR